MSLAADFLCLAALLAACLFAIPVWALWSVLGVIARILRRPR